MPVRRFPPRWLVGYGRFETCVALLWGLAAAWWLSEYTFGWGAFLFVLLPAPLLALASLTRFALIVRCTWRQRPPGRAVRRAIGFWAIVPAIGCFGVLLALTSLDFRVKLRLSEPALEQAARDNAAAGVDPGPGFIGLLFVLGVGGGPEGGTRFETGADMIDPYGLLYSPHGDPTDDGTGSVTYEHIRGPWWWYEEH